MNSCGEPYGYYPNASKSVLLVRDGQFGAACRLFEGTDVSVKADGIMLLGSPVGTEAYMMSAVEKKIKSWLVDLDKLSCVASSEPQAAYAAFIHGFYSRWTYFFRSCPVTNEQATCLEEKIRHSFIPSVSGKCSISDVERDWLALPNRMGGMGIINPVWFSESQYRASIAITQPLVMCLLRGERDLPYEATVEQAGLIKELSSIKQEVLTARAALVRDALQSDRQRLMDVACQRGASVWLSALPIKEHGFDLHKGSFRDAICVRFGWTPPQLPTSCVCGKSFDVDHALVCPTGGFPTLRHNEIRDLTAKLMKEVCHNVCREPLLQSLSGESLKYSTAGADGACSCG